MRRPDATVRRGANWRGVPGGGDVRQRGGGEQLELRGLDFLARLTGTTLPSTPPYTVRCVADKTPKVAKEAAKWVDRGVTFTSYLRSEAAQRGEPVELRSHACIITRCIVHHPLCRPLALQPCHPYARVVTPGGGPAAGARPLVAALLQGLDPELLAEAVKQKLPVLMVSQYPRLVEGLLDSARASQT
eukprot:1191218-Prorocentrum_minimum.AAC.2